MEIIGFSDSNELMKDVMKGKKGWTMFIEICGVKNYTNGKEIRNQFGEVVKV